MADRFTYHRSEDGSLTRRYFGHNDGTFTLYSEQDCEAIIQQNRRDRELQQAHGTRGEIFRKVASVPVDVFEQACREGWVEDDDRWKRWLNDGENRDFRVYEGRV